MLLWITARRTFATHSPRIVRNLLKTTADQYEAPVIAKGWVKTLRKQKHITFFNLDDGSSVDLLQVTVLDEKLRDLPLTFGSAVNVKGVIVPSKGAKQSVELLAHEITIMQPNDPKEYPFKIKEKHHVDHYRQYLHLRPRVEQFSSMLRVRSAATLAIHEYFQDLNFVLIHTPILTSNDCEGGGETFLITDDSKDKAEKDFFGSPVVLTVSGQLHLEAAACGLTRVYNFNPAFRAERQQSRRHLSEFWMVEAEISFLDSLDEMLSLIENMLKTVTEKVFNRCSEDIAYHLKNIAEPGHQAELDKMMTKPFVRVPYTEALKILLNSNEPFATQPKVGDNLTKDHELYLVKHFGNVPVFITHFPSKVKPFYARVCDEDSSYALAADLIVPDVGELFGGSLREHRYDILLERCRSLNLEEKLSWYLDLRKFGAPASGGFGMGFERYIQFLLGIVSIKDAIPFPRWIDHCSL